MATPSCSTLSAQSVTPYQATIGGVVVETDNVGGTYGWLYGTTPSANSQAAPEGSYSSAEGPQPSNLTTIFGLLPSTTYYFQFFIQPGSPLTGTYSGGILSFTTAAAPTYPPGAITGAAQNITPSSAVLTGQIYANGFDTTYSFEYGTTTGYGGSTPGADGGTQSQYVQVSSSLTGLAANTLYYFQLVATNTYGTTLGGQGSFVTNPAGGLLAFM